MRRKYDVASRKIVSKRVARSGYLICLLALMSMIKNANTPAIVRCEYLKHRDCKPEFRWRPEGEAPTESNHLTGKCKLPRRPPLVKANFVCI